MDASGSLDQKHDRHKAKTREGTDVVKVIHLVKNPFEVAAYYRTYRLSDNSHKYKRKVLKIVAEMAKHATAQMKHFPLTRLNQS